MISTFVCFFLQVAGRLAEFRDLVKEVVRSACRTALLEAGFTPDDYFMDMDSPMGMYAGMFVCHYHTNNHRKFVFNQKLNNHYYIKRNLNKT